jgi:cytochrome c-type protein NapC
MPKPGCGAEPAAIQFQLDLMISPNTLMISIFVLSAGLALLVIARPALTSTRGGKVFAFTALFLLPLLCTTIGTSAQMQGSEQTEFCLSCHIMEPYGKSLHVNDPKYIPAAHFQNHRIPADEACYTCHTDYALYGGFSAKWRGLHHVYVQYLGTPAQPIHLYTPYNNRECLHCHLGARSFEESPTHGALREDLVSNKLSCVTSGCHDVVHNVAGLGGVKLWEGLQ